MNDDFLGGNAYMVNKHLNNLVDRADVENSFESYKNMVKYVSADEDIENLLTWINSMEEIITNDLFGKKE